MVAPTVAVLAEPTRAERWRPVIAGGVAAAACVYVRAADPTRRSLLWPCPFLELTGWWCPGCGLTRACYSLMKGQVGRALGFNLLMPAIVLLFLGGWLRSVQIARGRPPRPISVPRWLSATAIGVVLGFTVLRNLPIQPFSALAP